MFQRHFIGAFAVLACTASFAQAEEVAVDAAQEDERIEFGLLPAINFNSDIGVGFGAIGVLAKIAPDADPYEWRLSLLFVRRPPTG